MNAYQNKRFSVLGDSVSTLYGYNPPDCGVFYTGERCFEANVFAKRDTWWGRVIDSLGGELLVNNSWSGSMVCRHPKCEIPSYGASDERTSSLGENGVTPDVVMVYLGINDWGAGMRIEPSVGEENDLSVFRVAYRVMLEKMKRNYPAAEIWCFTLGVSRCTAESAFRFPYQYAGTHIEEYCRIIRDCAAERNCKTIDLYRATSAGPYDTIDGFHPNAQGMETMADAVVRLATENP